MKTYDELTPEQQERAVEKAAGHLLEDILSGAVRFEGSAEWDNLQARIDAAGAEAERMQTPWFAHEYIMDTCRDEIMDMARGDAELAVYPEGEQVISGIA